jgi:hypothetical protein
MLNRHPQIAQISQIVLGIGRLHRSEHGRAWAIEFAGFKGKPRRAILEDSGL